MLMIDPPHGEAFGFPKRFDGDEDRINEWLLANGYPQEWIDRFPGGQVPCRIIDMANSEGRREDWPPATFQTRVTSRFLLLRTRARLLRVWPTDVNGAVDELERRDKKTHIDLVWLELLRQPMPVLFDAAVQDSEQGEPLRRAMPSNLALKLPAHRSDDRLMNMALWQIEHNERPDLIDGGTFDPVERQREKAIARERDEHDLAMGKVTAAQLSERNTFLSGLDMADARIVLPESGDFPKA